MVIFFGHHVLFIPLGEVCRYITEVGIFVGKVVVNNRVTGSSS